MYEIAQSFSAAKWMCEGVSVSVAEGWKLRLFVGAECGAVVATL